MAEETFEEFLQREGYVQRKRRLRKELRTPEARALRLEIHDNRRRPQDHRRTRMARVLLAILGGDTQAAAAQKEGVSTRTAGRWYSSWLVHGMDAFPPRQP